MRFNPWEHRSSEQLWAALTTTIVETAVGTMCRTLADQERYWFRLNAATIDRRRAQQELHRRIRSPLFKVSLFAALAPVLAAFLRASPATVDVLDIIPWADNEEEALRVVVGVPLALLGLAILHTVARFLLRPAADFLPADLFRLPVLTGTLLDTPVAGATPIADPLYRARFGRFHVHKHVIDRLVEDVNRYEWYLVVFIDDLDRCSPRDTAEVFEATNAILSAGFKHIRFVLAVDPAVVAAHLDSAYPTISEAKAVVTSDDPTAGWSFMRKLVQLPVILPAASIASRDEAVPKLLGVSVRADASRAGTDVVPAPSAVASKPAPGQTGAVESTSAPPPGADGTAATSDEAKVIIRNLVEDGTFQRELNDRLAARPDCSMRELKRLLNVWRFYVQLRKPDVTEACRLLVLAEIITRWPSLQGRLHRFVDKRRGLQLLADAAKAEPPAWTAALSRLKLNDERERGAYSALHALLRDHEGVEVAALAAELL